MLASFVDLLQERRHQRSALGAFTCYNFETAFGVLWATESLGSPAVLLISEKSFRASSGEYLVAGLKAVAEQAPGPVCLQLDHVSDLEVMESAFALGVGAVMADGAHMPLEENVRLVREAVEIARRYDGHVEAELGKIAGDEDVANAVAAGALTDPEQAAKYVELTGTDCLAVSIGNVHGTYRFSPTLDWTRLEAINSRTDVPLSLHGASGLEEKDFRRAISSGISKINVNTELRSRYIETISKRLPEVRPGSRVLELNLAVAGELAEVAAAKLALYEPGSSMSEANP